MRSFTVSLNLEYLKRMLHWEERKQSNKRCKEKKKGEEREGERSGLNKKTFVQEKEETRRNRKKEGVQEDKQADLSCLKTNLIDAFSTHVFLCLS